MYKKYINYLRNFYGTEKVQYKIFTINHLILRLNLHHSIKRFGNILKNKDNNEELISK